MRILVSTPATLTLVGDVLRWVPPYLLEDAAYSVQMALEPRCRVAAECSPGGRIRIRCHPVPSGSRIPELVSRVRMQIPLSSEKKLQFQAQGSPPAGIDLLPSQILSICVVLSVLDGSPRSGAQWVHHAREVASRLHRAPTGPEAYWAGLMGGLIRVVVAPEDPPVGRAAPANPEPERLISWIAARMIVLPAEIPPFTHLDACNLARRLATGDSALRDALRGSNEAARRVQDALAAAPEPDEEEFLAGVSEACRQLHLLRPHVFTDRLRQTVERAFAAGATAYTVSGTRTGCLLLFAPPHRREQVKRSLREVGCSPLGSSLTAEGLRLRLDPDPIRTTPARSGSPNGTAPGGGQTRSV